MNNNLDKLKKLQSSLMVLKQKLQNFHWNIEGPTFFEMHEETEKLGEEISQLVDQVAEKVVMHDTPAIGTMIEALNLSEIKEYPSDWVDSKTVANEIKNDLKKIMIVAQTVTGTATVQPILDEVFLVCDKYAWQFSKILKTTCSC